MEICSILTCKDVFKATGVHLAAAAGVQTEPHHLQVLEELGLGCVYPLKHRITYTLKSGAEVYRLWRRDMT